MKRSIAAMGLLIFAATGGFAQAPGEPLSFEVASVKPAPPPTGMGIRVMMGGGPGSGDPGRLNYSNVSLRDLIRQAYQVKEYQIKAPDWMGSERYDIVAKLPPKTTKEQMYVMLQNLLAERFKLTLHREKKELPVYALIVGKNGSLLKESVDDPNAPFPLSKEFGGLLPPPPPPGGGPAPKMAGSFMMMNGRGHLEARKMGIAGIVDFLARQLDRPVLDMTGLKGTYDFKLDYTPDENQRMQGPMGAIGPGMEAGSEGHAASEPSGPPLPSAIQEQLGLKLDARKSEIDLLVIDSAEKVPVEN